VWKLTLYSLGFIPRQVFFVNVHKNVLRTSKGFKYNKEIAESLKYNKEIAESLKYNKEIAESKPTWLCQCRLGKSQSLCLLPARDTLAELRGI
jgi:DNA-binding CsgD family transcriptional regulator